MYDQEYSSFNLQMTARDSVTDELDYLKYRRVIGLHNKPIERLDRLKDTFNFLEEILRDNVKFSSESEWDYVVSSFEPSRFNMRHKMNSKTILSTLWEMFIHNMLEHGHLDASLSQNILKCRWVLDALEPASDIEVYGTTLYTEYYLPFLVLGLLLLMILIAVVFLTKDYFGSSTIWNQVKFQQLARKSKVFKTSNLTY